MDANTVQVNWDKSPASDYGHVDAYAVYYKKTIDVVFPSVPTLVRYDILDSYTDTITGLNPIFGYDFIVYAFTTSAVKSTFDCVSCKNSVISYITPPVGGGYVGGATTIVQGSIIEQIQALRDAASSTTMHESAADITFFQPEASIIEELLKSPKWIIPAPTLQFLEPNDDIMEEFTKWPMWIIPR